MTEAHAEDLLEYILEYYIPDGDVASVHQAGDDIYLLVWCEIINDIAHDVYTISYGYEDELQPEERRYL